MSPEWAQSTWSPLFKMLVKSYDSPFSTLVKNDGCPHIVLSIARPGGVSQNNSNLQLQVLSCLFDIYF